MLLSWVLVFRMVCKPFRSALPTLESLEKNGDSASKHYMFVTFYFCPLLVQVCWLRAERDVLEDEEKGGKHSVLPLIVIDWKLNLLRTLNGHFYIANDYGKNVDNVLFFKKSCSNLLKFCKNNIPLPLIQVLLSCQSSWYSYWWVIVAGGHIRSLLVWHGSADGTPLCRSQSDHSQSVQVHTITAACALPFVSGVASHRQSHSQPVWSRWFGCWCLPLVWKACSGEVDCSAEGKSFIDKYVACRTVKESRNATLQPIVLPLTGTNPKCTSDLFPYLTEWHSNISSSKNKNDTLFFPLLPNYYLGAINRHF